MLSIAIPEKKGKIADDTCRLCLEEEETSKHVLCECVAVARIRLRHFGKGFLELRNLSEQTLKRVIKFFDELNLEDLHSKRKSTLGYS